MNHHATDELGYFVCQDSHGFLAFLTLVKTGLRGPSLYFQSSQHYEVLDTRGGWMTAEKAANDYASKTFKYFRYYAMSEVHKEW